jgi:hypothetical protein
MSDRKILGFVDREVMGDPNSFGTFLVGLKHSAEDLAIYANERDNDKKAARYWNSLATDIEKLKTKYNL